MEPVNYDPGYQASSYYQPGQGAALAQVPGVVPVVYGNSSNVPPTVVPVTYLPNQHPQ